MKAETIIGRHVASEIDDLASQQLDSCRDYERYEVIKAGRLGALGKFADFPQEDIESGIPKRFEKIVSKYPDRLAVKTPRCSLTYNKLNAMANRVAWSLLDYQESKTEPVAIFFDNGAELIATMLGVLKAGRFFVLLDPLHRKHRLASMLKDSQASLLITDRKNSSVGRKIINSDQQLLNFASLDQTITRENPVLQISPDTLAYITYTSGSTGEAKGVIHNHRDELLFLKRYTHIHGYCEQDVFSLLQSGTVNAIGISFKALLNGAALVLFDVRNMGVNALADWILSERISVCHISSPLFRSLCETVTGKGQFNDLRLIRLNGEASHKSDFELYKAHFPSTCVLVNGLASSETHTVALYLMNPKTIIAGDEIPVGYPMEGSDILLLDDDGHEVAKGEVGEIVVRSDYLSPGYWRRPDLTDSKFKPEPAGGTKRLYYTGDLGLMLSDGCLVHKGRKDFRVKIRGYGVDLVEVERVLLEHPAIEKAVVVAAKNESEENYLIAYFTSTATPPPGVSVLRSYLSATLPDYSVPSFFVQLKNFLLTSNGKIDRSALPKPDRLRPNLDVTYVEPRNPVEKKLAKIWAEVLGIERVGIRDDFFDLGGHSLIAAKLFGRIEKTFGKKLFPPTLLYARTIEQLADVMHQEDPPAASSLLVPLQPKGTKPPFFWACGFESDIHLPCLLGPDQPVYGLLNQCHDGNRPLYSRLEDIAAHHIKEIRTVQPQGPYYLGGFCFGGMVAFEMAQQLKQQGQQVALLFLLDLATIKNVKALTDRFSGPLKRVPSRESFRDKLPHHLGVLRKLRPRKQFAYLWVRAVDRINGLISKGRNIVMNMVCEVCVITGWPVPYFCQLKFITKVDIRVLRDYQPKPYNGRIVHVKAEGSTFNPELVAMLTAGELETYELPCYHWDLRREPHIKLWAEKLQSYLSAEPATLSPNGDKARANATKPSVSVFSEENNDESLRMEAIATR